jgi:hypothetical protein
MGHAIILASPFLIGLIWGFISPFIVRKLADRFETKLRQELADAGYPEPPQPELAQAALGVAAPETEDDPAEARVEVAAAAVEADRCPVTPLPTRPANLRTYVDWLVDTPQFLPTILLGAIGVVVAIAEARHVLLTGIVCGVAALLGILATVRIMTINPQKYSGVRRLGIFTIGALVTILINAVSAAIIIFAAA